MKKLLVLTLYGEKGASSQYRAFLFKDKFNDVFDVRWSAFWNDYYVTKYMHSKKKYAICILLQYVFNMLQRLYMLLCVAPRVDIIFVQKAVIPRCGFNFLGYAKKRGVRIVYDIDDAVYVYSRDYSDKIAELADIVICGNKLLADHFKKYNSNIIVIPTVENTAMYKKKWKDTFSNKIITWIGSETTIKNLDLIIEPLNRIIKRHPEVKFYIISNNALDYTKKIKNSVFIPWDKATYINHLSESTIGIMPLIDNEFNRGKCGFKLIQYLTAKKPVVGSNVGVNSMIIKKRGRVVESEKEWEASIETLLYDYDAYQSCCAYIEQEFFKEYDFDIVSEKIIKCLAGE